MKILVIDDDSLSLDLYRYWLMQLYRNWLTTLNDYSTESDRQFIVQLAENKEDVKNVFSRSSYDLTLLNDQIPGAAGIDLYKEFKDKMGFVVVCFSYAKKEKQNKLRNAFKSIKKDIQFITKPFTEETLNEIIKNRLGK